MTLRIHTHKIYTSARAHIIAYYYYYTIYHHDHHHDHHHNHTTSSNRKQQQKHNSQPRSNTQNMRDLCRGEGESYVLCALPCILRVHLHFFKNNKFNRRSCQCIDCSIRINTHSFIKAQSAIKKKTNSKEKLPKNFGNF